LNLANEGIVPLIGYSKEFTNSIEDIKDTENEVVNSIYACGVLEKPTFIAIKLSGLCLEEDLRKLERDVQDLLSTGSKNIKTRVNGLLNVKYPELWTRLQRISNAAKKNDVQLILDAELRFQGSVDSLPTSAILCWLLNSDKNNIWNTHQMYFALFLCNGRIFADAKDKLDIWSGNNPIKFVRGAYLNKEPQDKVAISKDQVDKSYDAAISEFLLHRTNSMIIASHNHKSIINAFELVQKIPGDGRMICFAQLYGMGDDITYGLVRARNNLGRRGGNVSVVKYIPYGGLHDVMPYLVRRAEENRGMLRGSMLEREALYAELKRRIFSVFTISLSRD
jgi:Proline dehydrogenase